MYLKRWEGKTVQKHRVYWKYSKCVFVWRRNKVNRKLWRKNGFMCYLVRRGGKITFMWGPLIFHLSTHKICLSRMKRKLDRGSLILKWQNAHGWSPVVSFFFFFLFFSNVFLSNVAFYFYFFFFWFSRCGALFLFFFFLMVSSATLPPLFLFFLLISWA